MTGRDDSGDWAGGAYGGTREAGRDLATVRLAGLTDAMHALAGTLNAEADDNDCSCEAKTARDAAQRISGVLGEHAELPPGLTAREAVTAAERDDLAAELDKLKPYLDEATRLLIGPRRFGAAARAAEIREQAGLPIIDQYSREGA